MNKALHTAGMTENDGKVYLALLKAGKSNVQAIMDNCGMHRKTIYDSLSRLAALGMVGSHAEGKKKFFTAADPSRLKDVMREKDLLVTRAIPGLMKLAGSAGTSTNVVVYKGKQGLVTIFEDILKCGTRSLDSLSSSGRGWRLMPEYVDNFHQRRVEAGIVYKLIYYSNVDKSVRARIKVQQKMKLTELRMLSQLSTIPISIWTYGGKVAFMIWDAETGILIEDKNVSKAFKDHFEVLWKLAKPV